MNERIILMFFMNIFRINQNSFSWIFIFFLEQLVEEILLKGDRENEKIPVLIEMM